MLCKVFCAGCSGLEAFTVTVEVDVTEGISFFMVGLPGSAVKESQQRISSALLRYGYRIPGRRIVINLAPAHLKKEGSSFDVAIAIGILSASGQVSFKNTGDFIILGELALDGSIREITGALPVALYAARQGYKYCIFPYVSALEAGELEEIKVFGVRTLRDVIDILQNPDHSADKIVNNGGGSGSACMVPARDFSYDFSQVKGQRLAKKGLEIAAAGGHNVIMIGSPGSGKTFMAKCLPSILPVMSREEALETSKIYSVAGLFSASGGLMRERPFRQPHHTATVQSLAGSGVYGLPGEISLAHNGVLFLDEFAEFDRRVLEILRQPLEDGMIHICRARTRVSYPAAFMLVAAMNPCPCGYLYDEKARCVCSSPAVMRYLSKISGPLMDRIDIQLDISPVPAEDMVNGGGTGEEAGGIIAERVKKARDLQSKRYAGENFYTNAQIPPSLVGKYCRTGRAETAFLKKAISRFHISARGYVRILKISRTIADLDGDDFISLGHISRAIQFKLRLNDSVNI